MYSIGPIWLRFCKKGNLNTTTSLFVF